MAHNLHASVRSGMFLNRFPTLSSAATMAAPADHWLTGGGEMGALIRSLDWSTTQVGPIDTWPHSLRTALGICLSSRFPMAIWWGPEVVQFYNDGYRPFLGGKHPRSMGQRGDECWAEIWDVCGPLYRHVMTTGGSTWSADLQLLMERNGYLEETYFTFAYSPIRDEAGNVQGNLITVTETTERVLGERRLQTLRELGAKATAGKTAVEACLIAAEILAGNGADIPFATLYLLDPAGRRAHLAGVAGVEPGTKAAVEVIELDDGGAMGRVVESGQGVVIDELSALGSLPTGMWTAPPKAAIVLPLTVADGVIGLLVAGVSPRRALDDSYRGFFDLLAGQIATAVGNARAYEQERRRAEALAELDRAKTLFFSNVSHEFRTPLTLMLGPLEHVLGDAEGITAEHRERLLIAHRNSLRLLKLVNTLLDFSRIEAGRAQATYEPTQLGTLTAELASSFRSACERAGLRLVTDCPLLPEPVYVDRDMWEKIVLNLLSNAFKFTFEGGIEVSVHQAGEIVELAVRDTGIGIPPEEQRNLFQRFHRVKGARSRTHEGTGIGLALVLELVKLHGGTLRVDSIPDKGSTFVVSIPTGTAHLPPERISAPRTVASTAVGARPYVEEALRWLPDGGTRADGTPAVDDIVTAVGDAVPATSHGGRILWADDNADMRDYVCRLLGVHYDVEAVANGAAALSAARVRRPDLVLADVMMPEMDGFELLRALRADPETRTVPVILLSARAGEEARVEGLEAGADDYLIKPFSALELMARVGVHLKMARVRREADRAKDEFLAMLGHELRNPLHAMGSAIALLRDPGTHAEVRGRARAVIDRQVGHLSRLVDDLLDVSRVTAGKITLSRRPLDLGALVASAVSTWRASGRLDHHRVTVSVEPLWVEADATRLEQIVWNLVGNAVKFTPEGGAISVRVRADGTQAVLEVDDTGIGIPADLIPRVFDLFVQAERSSDREQGGLGIGLTLVRTLVALHGGTVDAVSGGPGQGSRFIVRVPAIAAPDAPTSAHARVPPSSRSRRVLIVEDHGDAREMLRIALEQEGHEVHEAADGPSGLETALRLEPDIAFIDVGLPRLDGYEVARGIRHCPEGQRIYLVALTGYGQPQDRRRAEEAGFDEHFVKPVDPTLLAPIVARARR